MVSFHNQFMNFMLIGLVAISLLAFGITFQEENNAPYPIGDVELINNTYGNLREDLTSFRSEAQTQKDLFESENPTEGFGSILLFSVLSSGKVFNSMMIGVFNLLIALPAIILGLDPAVISVITTMLIISIIVGLWVLYKLGG